MLGVIGGMGTQATACFYEKLHSLQNVSVEQEFADVLIYSKPSTPDRTAYLTGKSNESPLDSLIHAAKTLEAGGANRIAVPCVTSHFFYIELSDSVSIPVLNILDETVDFAIEAGFKNICLLATDGTIKGGAFLKAFDKKGISVKTPDESIQAELMELIYDIKRSDTSCLKQRDRYCAIFESIIERTLKTGVDAIVLGCTELCIVAKEHPNVINTLDVLAKAALR